ncbi:MAG: endonuclease/exonuclease/phosphatase family protein [Anaerolineales bacterium]
MQIRVMTYNILNGGQTRENSILDVIQTAKPDVIILQEVFSDELLKFLSDALGMDYYMGAGNKKRKVALLSKLPIHSFKNHHPLFPIWRNFIDAEVEIEPNKTINIIGVHPIANLGFPFEIWRFWETKHILNYVQKSKIESCLIAGDFNAIAPKEKVKTENMPNWLKWIIYLQGNRVYHFSLQALISAGFTDCFRLLNSDAGFTLPPPTPNARLDYIFANDKMKNHLKNCWVVRDPKSTNLASDHYPVMAEFDFTN